MRESSRSIIACIAILQIFRDGDSCNNEYAYSLLSREQRKTNAVVNLMNIGMSDLLRASN